MSTVSDISGPYWSLLSSMVFAGVNFSTDTIKLLLVNKHYEPDYRMHSRRSDVTRFECRGDGYTPGGITSAALVEYGDHGLSVALTGGTFKNARFTSPSAAIYYISNDGSPVDDTLIFYSAFPVVIEMTGGELAVGGNRIDFGRSKDTKRT
jgi:hypothetical protein